MMLSVLCLDFFEIFLPVKFVKEKLLLLCYFVWDILPAAWVKEKKKAVNLTFLYGTIIFGDDSISNTIKRKL